MSQINIIQPEGARSNAMYLVELRREYDFYTNSYAIEIEIDGYYPKTNDI